MATSAHSTNPSEIDRRTTIRGLAAGAAVGFVAFERDPLLDAVNVYRSAIDDFNRNAPEDTEASYAYADQSYGPPMRVLDTWDTPARTREGAAAALEVALYEFDQHGENPLTEAMMKAALGFLST